MRFALEDEDRPPQLIETYQRAANSLRRILESLGLERRSKDITPDLHTYLEGKSRRVRIDRDDDDELEAAE